MKLSIFLLFVFSLISIKVSSQDVERILKDEPTFDMSGGIRAGMNYHYSNRRKVRSPFGYNLSAQLNFQLKSFDFPFRVYYRDARFSFHKPFVTFSASPSYKWITLHLGRRSMDFGRYIFSGRTFDGVGVELSPKNLRMKVMYGKLFTFDQQIDSLIFGASVFPAYDRNAMALQLGFDNGKSNFYITGFKAKDDINSISESERDINPFPARENMALGIEGTLPLFSVLRWETEAAVSLFSHNLEAGTTYVDSSIIKRFNQIYNINNSSRLHYAGHTSLGLYLRYFSISARYKRVSPFYQTAGLYNIQDDIQNITGNIGMRLFRNRLMANFRAGLNQDNISDLKGQSRQNLLLHTNINIKLTKKLSIGANINNNNFELKNNLIGVNDTILVAQNMQTWSLSSRYSWKSKNKVRHSINGNYNYNSFESILPQEARVTPTTISTYSGRYGLKPSEKAWSGTLGVNYQSINQEEETKRFTSTLGARFQRKDSKISLTSKVSFSYQTRDNLTDGTIIRTSINASYSLSEQINAYTSFQYLTRNTKISSALNRFFINAGIQANFKSIKK